LRATRRGPMPAFEAQSQLRVKLRKTQCEQISSQLPGKQTLLNTVGTSHLCQGRHRPLLGHSPAEQHDSSADRRRDDRCHQPAAERKQPADVIANECASDTNQCAVDIAHYRARRCSVFGFIGIDLLTRGGNIWIGMSALTLGAGSGTSLVLHFAVAGRADRPIRLVEKLSLQSLGGHIDRIVRIPDAGIRLTTLLFCERASP
jgi:hypothetical protein